MAYILDPSPFSPSVAEDQWIDTLLSNPARINPSPSYSDNYPETYNLPNDPQSMQNLQPQVSNSDLSSFLDTESLFSNSSRSSTASSTPPIKEEDNYDELAPDFMNNVSSKLQLMQQKNGLTPRALESIFDTKDVLKDTSESGPKPSAVSHSSSKRRRCPRKRLTDSQKEAHNKVEKKYRVNINSKINCLQSIIPWFAAPDQKMPADMKVNKLMILEKAYDYILHLQKENEEMKSRLETPNGY